ncbi:MAG: hypothetical protein Q8L89_03410 [Gammaproteobacteria bacterium]|nr:hypothetical protein [Gammaproteobacteria bacterium]
MVFLTDNDLNTHSQGRFLTDSTADYDAAKDNIEIQVIALVRSKLNGRYDVNAIFAATGTSRHPLVVRCASMLVIHDVIARNTARKVPEDIHTNYKWAMKWLDDVRNRDESPDGLPAIEVEEGQPTADILFGTTSDKNHFL